jgi:hypothetical protein
MTHEVSREELESFLAEHCDCWCMDDEDDRAMLASRVLQVFRLELKEGEKE